jgi:carbon monoxide dehydrogenase subunit G
LIEIAGRCVPLVTGFIRFRWMRIGLFALALAFATVVGVACSGPPQSPDAAAPLPVAKPSTLEPPLTATTTTTMLPPSSVPPLPLPPPPAPPPPPRLPGAPKNLTAVPGNAQVRLCWKPAVGAGGYTLYYRDVSAGRDWVRMPYPISGTCYTSQLMVNNHTYQFKVRGGNLAGEGGFSNVVTVTPAGPKPGVPTDLTAVPGNAQARLCWKPAPNADGYSLLYRDVSAGQDWVRMPYPISGTCYTSQLMVNNHTYEFKVCGGNLNGEGAFSNVVAVTPKP